MPMTDQAPGKASAGRYFEDFRLGDDLVHGTPRTVTTGDGALYTALTGNRFALACNDVLAAALGLPRAPLDDFLVFHLVFGKTVPDVSLNAIANLGYADIRFGAAVYPGDTLSARSTVIGLKQNSNGKTGVVHVRSVGCNQRGESVLDLVRWVMVRKRDPAAAAPAPRVPETAATVPPAAFHLPDGLAAAADPGAIATATGEPWTWEDYQPGDRIDHRDGMTIEEAEHMMATRLYHNTARVHFNQHAESAGRFGRRIVYGGHVISLARALSVNGLANAIKVVAINGGRHVAPCFAGDTVYAWSEVLESLALPAQSRFGAVRLRTVALKDRPAVAAGAGPDFPLAAAGGGDDPAVLLDLDYTVLVPRRGAG